MSSVKLDRFKEKKVLSEFESLSEIKLLVEKLFGFKHKSAPKYVPFSLLFFSITYFSFKF